MVSPDSAVNPAEVVARGIPAVAVFNTDVRSLALPLALDSVTAPVGGVTAEGATPALVTRILSEPPVAVVTARERRSVSPFALELSVVSAGGTIAEETAPVVVADGLL